MEIGSTENLKLLITKSMRLSDDEVPRFFDFIDSLCKKYSVSFVAMAVTMCLQKIGNGYCTTEQEKESFFWMMDETLTLMTKGGGGHD